MVMQAQSGAPRASYEELVTHLRAAIDAENVTPFFHPIVDLHTGEVFAHEVLTRGPRDTPIFGAEPLFTTAAKAGLDWELAKVCRTRALSAIGGMDPDAGMFFLNVNPNVVEHPHFPQEFNAEVFNRYGVDPARIVFEITERATVSSYAEFIELVRGITGQGFGVAIDDAGAGYSGLTMLVNMRPHFVKLDLELVKDIHVNGLKHNLIRFLVDFTKASGLTLIAEGIEHEDQLRALIRLGVHLGQGWMFAKPGPEVQGIPAHLREKVIEIARAETKSRFRNSRSVSVSNIALKQAAISPDATLLDLDQRFRSSPDQNGMPVVEKGRTAGLVMREPFYREHGGRLHEVSYSGKPIREVMDRHPMRVQTETPIEQVSLLAMSRPDQSLYDYVIVEDRDNYAGVVTVRHLLQTTTELEISYAKYANPLTGLAGDVMVEHEISRVISDASEFSVLFIDINSFKAYTDAYGFQRGEDVIRFTADTMRDVFGEALNSPFLGHVGGDDFVVVVENHHVEAAVTAFCAKFDTGRQAFFSEDDRARGFYTTLSRQGDTETHPLLSVAVSIINNKRRSFSDIRELRRMAVSLAHRCKEQVKRNQGQSAYVFERRLTLH
jgi:diguanylate cyclase (GGDEF)-like protein